MRQTLFILIVPAILGLSGCGAPRAVMYYDIQIPATPAPLTYTHPIEVTVGAHRRAGPARSVAPGLQNRTKPNRHVPIPPLDRGPCPDGLRRS